MSKSQQQPLPFQLPPSHGVVLKVPPQAPPRTFKPPNTNNINNNNVTPTPHIPPTVIVNNNNIPPVGSKPIINKVSPNPSPSVSPGVPRRPPPTPQSQQQQLQQQQQPPINNLPPPIVNLPPPPPMMNQSPHSSTNSLPPLVIPPPIISTSVNNSSPNTPTTPTSPMLNKLSPSSTPPPPKRVTSFKPVPTPINTPNGTTNPQPITMLGSALTSVPSLRTFSQPPAFVKSNSLDPKTMSSYTPPPPPPIVSANPLSNSSNSTSPNFQSTPNTSSPSILMPPPPPPINNLQHIGGEKRNSMSNPRLSQDLNSLFQNRLTNGLSPPVSIPFYDDKILSSANKTAELKDKRDLEEKERRDREKGKKEKEDQEKKDKKEKKEKGELEKKEQEKRKKDEQEKKKKDEQEKKDKEKKKKDDAKKAPKGLKGSGSITPPLIFNSSLDQIMEVQRERSESSYQDLPYPAFLKIITEGIIQYNGCSTEGIFRVPGTTSEVNRMKKQINEYDFTLTSDDPHVLAGLLKLWLRELTDPVIPQEVYYECIKSKSREDVTKQFNQLPTINREVLFYLLNFLKNVANPVNTPKTKMDADNIAMVFAPGLLRCPSNDPNMMLNTQFEKDFIKNLIDYIV